MTETTVVAEGSEEYGRIAEIGKNAVRQLQNFTSVTKWKKVGSKSSCKFYLSTSTQKWKTVKS